MMKLFVTGATGVLGRHVVPALTSAGHDVTAVARSDTGAAQLRTAGASPVTVDLFSADQISSTVAGHDVVLHLATNIPPGMSAARKKSWRINDRLRTEASAILASAALDAGIGRYIGESITFPYLDRGADWIDEHHERSYVDGTRSSVNAEEAAACVAASGGVGVSLRFAGFHDINSAHTATMVSAARKGFSLFLGPAENYMSFIDTSDAARAVVAALEVPTGVYNVAEAEPTTRAEHANALARAVGRTRLRSTPAIVQRLGGEMIETLSRSQRISTAALREASNWTPEVNVIHQWKDLP